MINFLYTNPIRGGYNIGNPGAAMEREYSHAVYLITSVIGNTTLAELESTPKDSDLVGGTSL